MLFGDRKRNHFVPRAESALILRSSVQVSYNSLRLWLMKHPEIRFIAVYSVEDAAQLNRTLAPRPVSVLPYWRGGQASNLFYALWQSFAAVVGRYGTVLVLCGTDEEAQTGHTAFRILGELLLGDHVVLVGPTVTQHWPGRRAFFTPRQVYELVALIVVAAIGLFTTAVALAAVALEEALGRVSLRR